MSLVRPLRLHAYRIVTSSSSSPREHIFGLRRLVKLLAQVMLQVHHEQRNPLPRHRFIASFQGNPSLFALPG